MAPPAYPASLISTATSIPTLSSRYDSRRKLQSFPCLLWRVSYQVLFFFGLDPRNGRRRRGARVLQINRLRLFLPSRADLPEDGPESVSPDILHLYPRKTNIPHYPTSMTHTLPYPPQPKLKHKCPTSTNTHLPAKSATSPSSRPSDIS
jgi:hypothetical protein